MNFITIGIAKDDYEARNETNAGKFSFFGAPVGMFITMDEGLLKNFIDLECYTKHFSRCKREGLHTCGQVAFTKFHSILSKELGFDENEMLVCGVSMVMRMRMHLKIN